MGSIEFLGLLDDSFTFGNVNIPENANIFIGTFENFNVLNWLLFSIPIISIFVIIGIIKQRKYGILNKEIRNKQKEENINKYNLNTSKKQMLFAIKQFFKVFITFYIIAIVIMIIHELLHAFVGMLLGGNMKVAIIPGGAVTITSSAMTRTQYLFILLTPVITMGIIPSIVLTLIYPKKIGNSFKKSFITWFCMIAFVSMIFSASPDIISTYNIFKEVPKGAIMQQDDENMYWYMKKDTK